MGLTGIVTTIFIKFLHLLNSNSICANGWKAISALVGVISIRRISLYVRVSCVKYCLTSLVHLGKNRIPGADCLLFSKRYSRTGMVYWKAIIMAEIFRLSFLCCTISVFVWNGRLRDNFIKLIPSYITRIVTEWCNKGLLLTLVIHLRYSYCVLRLICFLSGILCFKPSCQVRDS